MANILSNKKSAEKAKRDRIVNKAEKTYLRNRIKAAKTTGSFEDVNLAMKTLDSKAAKGLIKKTTARRLKSRTAKAANKVNSPKVIS